MILLFTKAKFNIVFLWDDIFPPAMLESLNTRGKEDLRKYFCGVNPVNTEVVEKCEATVLHSSNCDDRCVGKRIVLMEQHPFCQFFRVG